MDMDYKTAASAARAEYDEKRSKFIATVSPAADEKSALDFINGVKAEFHDARHNVFAYVIKDGAERFSDDGEPQGTGGMPVLAILKKRMLFNTAVTVTRYFGGVLLGAPGLLRAYTRAAAMALDKAGSAFMLLCEIVKITCDYGFYARAEKFINGCGGFIKNRDFGETVTVTVLVPQKAAESFRARLVELSAGKASVIFAGLTYANDDLPGFRATD